MNIRECFKILFGPDLIDLMKNNKKYYNKILSYSKTKPNQAIVIDDNPTMLHHAKSVGITVIQSCQDGQKPEFDNFFTSSKELISTLKAI